MGTPERSHRSDVVAPFGCDRCGHPMSDHSEERGGCPVRGRYSRATWQQSSHWNDDGHALAIQLVYGEPHPVIVHPESGCPTVLCGYCREDSGEDPNPDCEKCNGTGYNPSGQCWLDHFLGEVGREFFELTPWGIDTPINGPVPILWRGDWDDFRWRPRDAIASTSGQSS